MAVTIKDIANETGLGLATISSYLNGGNVRAYNKEKIEAAIDKLGYEVNEIARGLKTNRTKIIGVLVPAMDNIFSMKIVTYLEDIFRKQGYAVIVSDCRSDIELEKEAAEFLYHRRIDGIITFPIDGKGNYLKKFVKAGKPIIAIDRLMKDVSCDCVLVDNKGIAKDAIEYLVKAGHQNIGIICGPQEIYTARQRLLGYEEGLKSCGLELHQDQITYGNYTIQGGALAMKELIHKGKVTAVFATNYEMTVGAMITLNELNVDIPKEMSVIGFDNLEFAKATRPNLDIVIQPMVEIAENAANIMLQRLQGAEVEKQNIKLKAELIKGSSVRKI